MAEVDIDDIIATSDGDTTWGADMRGAITTLQQRAWGRYLSGKHYDQRGPMQSYVAQSNAALTANEVNLYPFVPGTDVTIDRIGVVVSTGHASNTKIMVYSSSTSDPWYADALLLETGNLDVSTTGYKYADLSGTPFTFQGATNYHFAIWSSGTAQYNTVAAGGISTSTGFIDATSIYQAALGYKSIAYGAAPSPWVTAGTSIYGIPNPVSIRFRVV